MSLTARDSILFRKKDLSLEKVMAKEEASFLVHYLLGIFNELAERRVWGTAGLKTQAWSCQQSFQVRGLCRH